MTDALVINKPCSLRAANNRVRSRKAHGDDRYSWCLFVDGREVMSGMDKAEVAWRKKKAINNIMAGRVWHALPVL